MDNAIDYEEDQRGLVVPEEGLKELGRLGAMQVGIQARIDELQQEMTRLNTELRGISEQDIPNLMSSLGVSQFSLYDGTGIEVETGITATISKANEAKAHAWLDKHGHGDIIKNVVAVQFNREDAEKARKLYEALLKKKLNVTRKQGVHASTLKAFVNREIEKERDDPEYKVIKKKDRLPRELFGVYEYQKTVIKMP